jgi:hypothetical protein
VSEAWILVLAVGVATVAIKGAGPVLLGSRELPGRIATPLSVLAPALLAALVVVNTVGGDRSIVLDARLAGVGAALVALRFRAPLLAVVAVAALVTAVVRAVS